MARRSNAGLPYKAIVDHGNIIAQGVLVGTQGQLNAQSTFILDQMREMLAPLAKAPPVAKATGAVAKEAAVANKVQRAQLAKEEAKVKAEANKVQRAQLAKEKAKARAKDKAAERLTAAINAAKAAGVPM